MSMGMSVRFDGTEPDDGGQVMFINEQHARDTQAQGGNHLIFDSKEFLGVWVRMRIHGTAFRQERDLGRPKFWQGSRVIELARTRRLMRALKSNSHADIIRTNTLRMLK
jgi:hypothetical protein